MSETVDRLPISRVSFGIAPMLLVGVIYTLAGVVALLTGSEPPFGWLTPMLGVWFLGISARKLYFSPPDDDSVADYWIVFQYVSALILLVLYASEVGLISL